MLFKLLCVLAITAPILGLTSPASAQTSPPRHVSLPKTVGVAKSETVSSLFVGRNLRWVLPQDLFDRNNPNNLRSDYPAPPAQPGQF
jgi:hypothetical protein